VSLWTNGLIRGSYQRLDDLEGKILQPALSSKGGLERQDNHIESKIVHQIVSSLHQNHTQSCNGRGSPGVFALERSVEESGNEVQVPKKKLRRPTRKRQENRHSGTTLETVRAYAVQKSRRPRLPIGELVLTTDRVPPLVGEESASISFSRFQLSSYIDLSPNSRRFLKTSLKCSDGFDGQELRPTGKTVPVRRQRYYQRPYKKIKRIGELAIVSSRTFGDDAGLYEDNIEGFSSSMIACKGRQERCKTVSKNLKRIEDREGGIQRQRRMSDFKSLVTPIEIGNSFGTSFFVESPIEQRILHASLELGDLYRSPPTSQRSASLSDEIHRSQRYRVFESSSYITSASGTLRNHQGIYKLSRSKSMPSHVSAVAGSDCASISGVALNQSFRKTMFPHKRSISHARAKPGQEVNLRRLTKMLNTKFGTIPARGRVQSLPFKPPFKEF
jgi:hypothetical protein